VRGHAVDPEATQDVSRLESSWGQQARQRPKMSSERSAVIARTTCGEDVSVGRCSGAVTL
jgi:hypothetical protein